MPKADDVQGVASSPILAGLDERGKLSRLGARSGAPLPGSIVKMTGYFAPVRVGRISMVGDGFVVKKVGIVNE